MKQNSIFCVILVLILFTQPVFALNKASSNALDAFSRYEPDFSSSLRKLQELDRKIENQNIGLTSQKFEEIALQAEDVFEYVQHRYELMEDLFKSVSGDYPNDRPQLFDGFQRIDDLYRECRDFYTDKFKERDTAVPVSTTVPDKTVAKEKSFEKPKRVKITAASAKAAGIAVATDKSGSRKSWARREEPKQEERTRLHGTFKLDLRNRNENYTAANTTLPNNLSQSRLSLTHKINEKSKIILEDKYLQRRRNELVKENLLTLTYFTKPNKANAFTAKDTLHHVWYPQNGTKDYRDNLAELFWNYRKGKWERLTNLGLETRVYPRYTRSDFKQLNYQGQTTYFVPNGTLFCESTFNWRDYKNSPQLDYMNTNYYLEFNRFYTGNKSEMSVSNTWDKRNFGQEAINLYRASYWDNYFRFRYDLPVSKTFTWVFEDEFQQRKYASDDPRGYSQLKLRTLAKITIDKKSRAKLQHTYTYNHENTEAKAHKNHEYYGSWEKKFSKTFKVKVDDNYHQRSTIIGNVMDFRENLMTAKATWQLPNKVELTWRNELLAREYDTLFFRDYKYFLSGLQASYAKRKKYDWKIEQSYRKFSFKNGGNVATAWNHQTQPVSSAKINFMLRDDLKLKLWASREKTYYKSFDTLSQELLWDFTRPVTITEFYGGLEYTF